jgi:hypothetical protein
MKIVVEEAAEVYVTYDIVIQNAGIVDHDICSSAIDSLGSHLLASTALS